MKKYCPSCGFGTEYQMSQSPKKCTSCGEKLDIVVSKSSYTPAPIAPPPPTITRPKSRPVAREELEEESTGEIGNYNLEAAARGVRIEGEKQVVRFGEVAQQQKTGMGARPKQKVKKQSKEEFQAQMLALAGSKRRNIDIDES